MNVGELKAALRDFPDDLEVRLEDWNEDYAQPWPLGAAERSRHTETTYSGGGTMKNGVWCSDKSKTQAFDYLLLRGADLD